MQRQDIHGDAQSNASRALGGGTGHQQGGRQDGKTPVVMQLRQPDRVKAQPIRLSDLIEKLFVQLRLLASFRTLQFSEEATLHRAILSSGYSSLSWSL
jgi:hypothetical protein